MVKRFSTGMLCASLIAVLAVAPVAAKPSDEDIAGALVILGAAALMHHDRHYKESYSPSGAQATADFEVGYRDGLHGVDYVNSSGNPDYAYGYDAGSKERTNHLAHKTRAGANEVPSDTLRACAGGIADQFGVGIHDVHIIKTVVRGSNDFLIEGAVGHSHMTCVMGASASMVEIYAGRIQ